MRKLPLLFFMTIFAVMSSQSQTRDTILRDMSREQYNNLLNQQFRSLLSGYTGPSVGSYAALDLSESKKVTFAPTFALKNGNLLTGKFNAGITDGFTEIFNNSSLNTNLSVDFEYNAIGLRNKKLSGTMLILDAFQRRDFARKKQEINDAFSIDSVRIVTGQKRRQKINALIADTVALRTRYDHINRIIAFNNLMNLIPIIPSYSPQYIDSLSDTLAIISVKLRLDLRNIAEQQIAEQAWIDKAYDERLVKRAGELRPYRDENLTVYGFRFGWFTFGIQVRNDSFKLFDTINTLPEERLISEKFISNQLRARYSIYQWKPGTGTYFLSVGVTYNNKSNYLDLTSTNVSITTNHGDYSTDSTKTVSVVEKYNAYAGQYKRYIDELILDADFYYFFTKKNAFAVHVYPNLKFTEGIKPTFNMGFGILYPFKDAKDEKSIVNAELYYNLIDVTQSTKDDFRLYKQSKIGLRFSFPINFKRNQ